MSMFMTAARKKFRFNTPKGQLSVEDLFDLPLTAKAGQVSLDSIAVALDSELQSGSQRSFVVQHKQKDGDTETKFDIVMSIIKLRKAEVEAAQKAAYVKEQKQKIMALIEEKQHDALRGASIEELTSMLDSLAAM